MPRTRRNPASKGTLIALAVGVGIVLLLVTKKASAMQSNILSRLAVVLTPAQMANAQIIAGDFAAAGQPDNLTAAAIVNAWAESGLDEKKTGDHNHSIGLFMLDDVGGDGIGLSRQYREDPHNNIHVILSKEVLRGRGATLRARAAAGAGVAELAAIFSRDILRPGDQAGEMTKRSDLAQTMFPEIADTMVA